MSRRQRPKLERQPSTSRLVGELTDQIERIKSKLSVNTPAAVAAPGAPSREVMFEQTYTVSGDAIVFSKFLRNLVDNMVGRMLSGRPGFLSADVLEYSHSVPSRATHRLAMVYSTFSVQVRLTSTYHVADVARALDTEEWPEEYFESLPDDVHIMATHPRLLACLELPWPEEGSAEKPPTPATRATRLTRRRLSSSHRPIFTPPPPLTKSSSRTSMRPMRRWQVEKVAAGLVDSILSSTVNSIERERMADELSPFVDEFFRDSVLSPAIAITDS